MTFSDALVAALLAAELARRDAPPISFRAFQESPEFCDLALSPLIAAIADASAGCRVTTLDDETAEKHFGCTVDALPTAPPRTVVVRAGGRGGKTSRLLAPKALHAAWTVPLPTLGKGEHAFAIIIAPDFKLAQQTFSFCRGYVEASPTLSAALVGEPTKEELTLRRPDGHLVTVRCVAATRGGKGGRGKTLVFAGLDEACFFFDEASGVVNDNEIYRAVIQRIVPGGQCWIVSTPWIAQVGLLEELLGKNFGTHAQALCAVAPTRALNPTWDPTGEIERDLRENDPDNAAREIDAVPLAAGSNAFFDRVVIDAAMDEDRAEVLAPVPGGSYGAGGDFAFRRDSSALAITAALEAAYELARLEEQRPEKGVPLKPSAVCGDFASVLTAYGLGEVACDDHERASVDAELVPFGITTCSLPAGQPGKAQTYTFTRTLLREGRLKLPMHPRLRRQMQAVTVRAMPGGGMAITSPRQAGGGHGDLVSALVASVWHAAFGTHRIPIPELPAAPPLRTDARELSAFASR